jgi:hypothetical protein
VPASHGALYGSHRSLQQWVVHVEEYVRAVPPSTHGQGFALCEVILPTSRKSNPGVAVTGPTIGLPPASPL